MSAGSCKTGLQLGHCCHHSRCLPFKAKVLQVFADGSLSTEERLKPTPRRAVEHEESREKKVRESQVSTNNNFVLDWVIFEGKKKKKK